MTATATLYTSFGFAIAADGRRSWRYANTAASREGQSDTVQKIFEIVGKDAVFAYCIRGQTVNEHLSWDIATELAASSISVRAKRFSNVIQFIGTLCSDLSGRIERAKTEGVLEGFPTSEVSFIGYFRSLPCWIDAQFRPFNGRLHHRLIKRDCEPGRHVVCGSEILDRMIQDGDPKMMHLFLGFNGEDAALKTAVTSVKQYIEACCSPLIRRLDHDCERRIGGHIHVATITKPYNPPWLARLSGMRTSGGFEWVIPPISETSSNAS